VKLADLLAADRILLDVEGQTVREAAGPLMQAVIGSGQAADSEKLEALLAESLPREAVTVGQQAFLLHFRTEGVVAPTAALGVTRQPIHRQHDPAREARVLLMLLAPPKHAAVALAALGAFARALAEEAVVEALLAGADSAALVALPGFAREVPGDLAVRDVMASPTATLTPDDTLGHALDLMLRHDEPALPVVSDNQDVLGQVTYGEVLQYLLPSYAKRMSGATRRGAAYADPRDRPVRDAMDRSVLCLSDDQRLADAAALLVNKRLERVPVVRDGQLVGMLTREGIVRRLFG
jgi:CBS domain-containing protein